VGAAGVLLPSARQGTHTHCAVQCDQVKCQKKQVLEYISTSLKMRTGRILTQAACRCQEELSSGGLPV
jgi:hypothetical protein